MNDEGGPIETKARPKGSGYQRVDLALVQEMRALRLTGAAATSTEAARAVAGRAHGTGGFDSKVRRLVRLDQALFGELSPKSHQSSISLRGVVSPKHDSLEGMVTAAEHQQIVAELAAEQAANAQLAANLDEAIELLVGAREKLGKAANVLDRVERMAELEQGLLPPEGTVR